MSTAIITTTGLTKRFGDFTAVDALSIAVAPGSIFAFLGANGSGKSTTIRMLIGLLRPSAGTASVDGVDVTHDPRRVRDRIGYMGQKVSLYQGLTIGENVEFYAGLYGLGAQALAARWGALRERFALADAEREKPENLPAGVRQRAGLALATLHQPRVLFLDEPTAGVDVESRGLFWNVIQEEAARGVTVFVTTHFLEEVDYCDWVSFIDAGRLIANASPEELRRRFSPGYGVTVELPGGASESVAQRLRALGLDGLAATSTGFAGRVPQLDTTGLAALDALATAVPGARVRIEQPEMTEVFRQVLAEAPAS